MKEIILLPFVAALLFVVICFPIAGIIALIKPRRFKFLGENRKKICLKIFGAWIVGCAVIAVFPWNNDTQNTPNQKQEQLQAEKDKLETEKAKVEQAKAAVDKTNSKMTLEKYNRIQTGMTAEEVKEIVGSLGKVASESDVGGYKTIVLQFEGSGSLGANANVTFQNGRVVMKAQAGLK